MTKISWLESLAQMTDYDPNVQKILHEQSEDIQRAYQSNNQYALKALMGCTDKLACKNTVFQL